MDNNAQYSFLRGGGEMGELTRTYNWAATPAGPIEQWPQSLRTTVGIVLQSVFPMVLFLGEDLITFYNDAYSEILKSADRHPALGKKASELWPEGWKVVEPFLKKVYHEGEVVYFEDQLIPVERNGQIEDVYWTFKYSPHFSETGEIAGVFVTCAETTNTVTNLKQLIESKEELEFAIEATELGTWELNPLTNTIKANSRLKEWFGLSPEDEVPLSLATDIVVEEDRQKVIDAINYALKYESGGRYDIEYTILNPITNIKRIVRAKGRSWFNDDNIAYRFSGTLQDVTEQVLSRIKIEESEQRFRNLVSEAIVSTAILSGPDLVLELANDAMLNIWSRDKSIIGKPLLEFMPEIKDQPFPKLLKKVMDTGEPFVAQDALVKLEKNGTIEEMYMDFSYKALKNEHNENTSILVMATDVTEKVLASEKLRQSEENLRNTILKAPVAMAIFKGPEHVVEIANEKILELWNKSADEVVGKPQFEGLPEASNQGFEELFNMVYNEGKTFSAQGMPATLQRNGQLSTVYVNFVFEPYKDPDGQTIGIIAVALDVTDQVLAQKRIEQSEQRVRAIIESAPFPIGVYEGEEMIISVANQTMMDIWGKGNDVVNKRYAEVLPEMQEQKVYSQLKQVYKSGIPFHAKNQYLDLIIDGKAKPYYFHYSFTPLFDSEGKVYGVMNTGADVTDLNLAKQKVEQSEENFRNMILQAPVAMCILMGADHIIDIANDFMVELWGKQREEVMDKPIWEAVPEATEQGLEQLLKWVYESGESFSASERPVQLSRNGIIETIYQNFVYQPYRNSDGEILGVLVISIDVTSQVLSRLKIEESEQRVRALVQSAPFPIGAYSGREMKIELANQSILDIWAKGEDVIGKSYIEILPELENQEIFEQLHSVYDTGVAFHARNQRVDIVVDNKIIPYYFNYSFTPLYDAAGNVYGVMNTAADVTDLNLALQKVEQSEENFRNMILQAPVAMCILLGPDHVIDIANDFMVELWGKQREAVIGKPLWEALPDAAEQGLEQLLKWVYETGETFSASERPVELLRNGVTETVYQNFVYEPYKNSEGKILGVLAISIDVTAQVIARHKIEEVVRERTAELEQVNNNLENTNAELAQFAYITSHDLQEPIRKISIFTKMLESGLSGLDERQAGYINKIKLSAERMTNLIKDVLLYSQLSKGQQPFEKVDLNKVVNEALTDFELVIEQNHAVITCDILPVVEAIPLQMAQLFGNLISNSLKYSASGVAPVINITSSLLTANDIKHFNGLDNTMSYYKIEFKDNGIGFEPEYADKIFHIFQRLHTKSEYSGTGIGLAMCKRIMENHNGDITAAPREEGGAVFTIILPVKQ